MQKPARIRHREPAGFGLERLKTAKRSLRANRTFVYAFDHLHRLESRRLTGGVNWETRFTFRNQNSTYTTTQIEWMTHIIGTEHLRYRYEYGTLGKITRWHDPVMGVDHQYRYDNQNQLVWEQIGTPNTAQYHTFEYRYDTFGNIRSRTHNGWTTTFSYDYDLWPDLLTAVDGNPITYVSVKQTLAKW